MGYSCLAVADEYMRSMMRVLREGSGAVDSGNGWRIDGVEYFEERGREQLDGACTGSVWRIVAEGKCRKVGSYRVDATGVVRWPSSTAAQRERARIQAKLPGLWAIGSGGLR